MFLDAHSCRDEELGAKGGFRRLDPREQATALVDAGSAIAPNRVRTRRPARAVLEALIRPVVTGSRCYVLFSGGRDSSALLALATHVARTVGADDPIPVTARHVNAPRSVETEWQNVVIEHLALPEHIVFEFHGEQSLLADDTRQSLRRNGLIWPPAVHVHAAYYSRLEPGNVILGEGGDLIISGRRISSVTAAVRGRHPRRAWRAVFGESRRAHRRDADESVRAYAPWLTDAGAEAFVELLSTQRPESLSWRRAVRRLMSPRVYQVGSFNIHAMARAHGFTPSTPFEDPEFIAALAEEGGFWGLGDRTAVMRYLFHDLLPDAVLARSTKAAFNETRWGEREREFAKQWTGAGVDPTYIDVERLRRSWLDDEQLPLSALHLHAAWLADHGLPTVPA